MTQIIAQGFGILGLIITVYSFQVKQNRKFFIVQGIGGFMFFLNFVMIGAVAGALYNVTKLIRGVLFSKYEGRLWPLIVIEAMYLGCFVFSVFTTKDDVFQIVLSALPLVALLIMNVLMYKGDGKTIRIFQTVCLSPSWILHNIFNFTLGGLICEVFNMISAVLALVRFKKEGFN